MLKHLVKRRAVREELVSSTHGRPRCWLGQGALPAVLGAVAPLTVGAPRPLPHREVDERRVTGGPQGLCAVGVEHPPLPGTHGAGGDGHGVVHEGERHGLVRGPALLLGVDRQGGLGDLGPHQLLAGPDAVNDDDVAAVLREADLLRHVLLADHHADAADVVVATIGHLPGGHLHHAVLEGVGPHLAIGADIRRRVGTRAPRHTGGNAEADGGGEQDAGDAGETALHHEISSFFVVSSQTWDAGL